jgi:multiple sugar transport system permease protein
MTNGGPYGVTELPITFMYRQGFSNSQLGYASAIACLMFVVVGIITVLILRLQRSDGRKS